MNILINILVPILCIIIGYLFGSISNSILIGKLFFHQDPRDFGSKNAGATNSGRLWGKKIGFLIIVLDIMKGFIPFVAIRLLLTYISVNGMVLLPKPADFISGNISSFYIHWPVYWMVALGTFFGHCYPIFHQFKGGKVVTVYFTMFAEACPALAFGILLTTYLVTLKISKYVSLSAFVTTVVCSTISWILTILFLCGVLPYSVMFGMSWFGYVDCGLVFSILATLGGLLLFWRHRSNIERLKSGTERKISWM